VPAVGASSVGQLAGHWFVIGEEGRHVDGVVAGCRRIGRTYGQMQQD
jgi:hypothetical protein